MKTFARVQMTTDLGTIIAELDLARAPITAANILAYVDSGAFEAIAFYRIIRPDNDLRGEGIEIIQGGFGALLDARRGPPIEHEPTSTTGLFHVAGTLSFGRYEPGSATSEFFIVLKDAPQLDAGGPLSGDGQGYSAFGRVISGLDVAFRINQGAVGTPENGPDFMTGQALIAPVRVAVRRI